MNSCALVKQIPGARQHSIHYEISGCDQSVFEAAEATAKALMDLF